MAHDRQTVVGVFHDRDDAEQAVEALRRAGFRDEQIGFVMQSGDGEERIDGEEHAPGSTGVVGGIIAGAGIGGLIAAGGALLIPGFGPVVAGGILAAVLGGAAIGAAAGGIIGALVDMGIPEEEARYYENEIQEGRILVTVKTDGRYDEAQDILRGHHAYDIEDRDAIAEDTSMYRGSMVADTHMTRRPSAPQADHVDSVQLHQEPRSERRGEVNVQESRGALITDWNEMSPRYRERWRSRWGSSGGRWDEYEPGYRYSYEMSRDPRFQNRSWDDIETDLRHVYGTWSQRHGYRYADSDWDRMREQLREAWENDRETRRAA